MAGVARLRKSVITAAGLGTRLMPATRELPKEMFPFCVYDSNGHLSMKPMIQLIFESLYSHGLRKFCFVVGRRKRSIEDFFTEDPPLLDLVSGTNNGVATELRELFTKLRSSEFAFVSQPEPRGFGDAILRSKAFVGDDDFILHAGDDIILSEDNNHLRRLEVAFRNHGATIACLLAHSESPELYGVVTGKNLGDGSILIDSVEEKPSNPKSNMVVVAVYAFAPMLFDYLGSARTNAPRERQLEAALKSMLAEGHRFVGVQLGPNEKRIDIGNPASYLSSMEFLLRRTSPSKILA